MIDVYNTSTGRPHTTDLGRGFRVSEVFAIGIVGSIKGSCPAPKPHSMALGRRRLYKAPGLNPNWCRIQWAV